MQEYQCYKKTSAVESKQNNPKIGESNQHNPRSSSSTLVNLQAASQALNGRAARAVTRPGPFGNPFAKRDEAAQYFIINEIKFEAWVKGDTQLEGNALLVDAFARWIMETTDGWTFANRVRAELPGLNLACFCPSHLPCHADVLLAIANGRDIRTALPWRTA